MKKLFTVLLSILLAGPALSDTPDMLAPAGIAEIGMMNTPGPAAASHARAPFILSDTAGPAAFVTNGKRIIFSAQSLRSLYLLTQRARTQGAALEAVCPLHEDGHVENIFILSDDDSLMEALTLQRPPPLGPDELSAISENQEVLRISIFPEKPGPALIEGPDFFKSVRGFVIAHGQEQTPGQRDELLLLYEPDGVNTRVLPEPPSKIDTIMWEDEEEKRISAIARYLAAFKILEEGGRAHGLSAVRDVSMTPELNSGHLAQELHSERMLSSPYYKGSSHKPKEGTFSEIFTVESAQISRSNGMQVAFFLLNAVKEGEPHSYIKFRVFHNNLDIYLSPAMHARFTAVFRDDPLTGLFLLIDYAFIRSHDAAAHLPRGVVRQHIDRYLAIFYARENAGERFWKLFEPERALIDNPWMQAVIPRPPDHDNFISTITQILTPDNEHKIARYNEVDTMSDEEILAAANVVTRTIVCEFGANDFARSKRDSGQRAWSVRELFIMPTAGKVDLYQVFSVFCLPDADSPSFPSERTQKDFTSAYLLIKALHILSRDTSLTMITSDDVPELLAYINNEDRSQDEKRTILSKLMGLADLLSRSDSASRRESLDNLRSIIETLQETSDAWKTEIAGMSCTARIVQALRESADAPNALPAPNAGNNQPNLSL